MIMDPNSKLMKAYLKYVQKERDVVTGILAVGICIGTLADSYLNGTISYTFIAAGAGLILLMYVRMATIRYRVNKGIFGQTEHEIKALVDFVLQWDLVTSEEGKKE